MASAMGLHSDPGVLTIADTAYEGVARLLFAVTYKITLVMHSSIVLQCHKSQLSRLRAFRTATISVVCCIRSNADVRRADGFSIRTCADDCDG